MLTEVKKQRILNEIERGKKSKAISTIILKIIDLMLNGDTDFDLIYLSGRGVCIGIRIREELGSKTARNLLVNGYKQECLKLSKNKRI